MKDNEIYLSSLLARQEHIHSEDPAHASPHGSRSNVHFTSNGENIVAIHFLLFQTEPIQSNPQTNQADWSIVAMHRHTDAKFVDMKAKYYTLTLIVENNQIQS
jgi:hypothetical protein